MNNQASAEVDAQIDDWKDSEEFENLLHGDELVADFDKYCLENNNEA